MNYNPFKSRTNWLQVGIIIIALLNASIAFVPVQYQDVITAILAALAILTHTSTAVNAGAKN